MAHDVAAMKASGMAVWSSSDIFVLPLTIYTALQSKITSGSRDGKHIAMNNFTLGVLLPGMIDEVRVRLSLRVCVCVCVCV